MLVSSSVMRNMNCKMVLSLFNECHDFSSRTHSEVHQLATGTPGQVIQKETLFAKAGLVRKPNSEVYEGHGYNYAYYVGVDASSAGTGGKGVAKHRFSMNGSNSDTGYNEDSDNVKLLHAFNFTVPVFAALYHLYKKKLQVLHSFFTLFTDQQREYCTRMQLNLEPMFPLPTTSLDIENGTGITLRKDALWHYWDKELDKDNTKLPRYIVPITLIELIYRFDACRRARHAPEGWQTYSDVLRYISGGPIRQESSIVQAELEEQIPYDELIWGMDTVRQYVNYWEDKAIPAVKLPPFTTSTQDSADNGSIAFLNEEVLQTAETLWTTYDIGYKVVKNYLTVVTGGSYVENLNKRYVIDNFIHSNAYATELNYAVLMDSLDEIKNFVNKHPLSQKVSKSDKEDSELLVDEKDPELNYKGIKSVYDLRDILSDTKGMRSVAECLFEDRTGCPRRMREREVPASDAIKPISDMDTDQMVDNYISTCISSHPSPLELDILRSVFEQSVPSGSDSRST